MKTATLPPSLQRREPSRQPAPPRRQKPATSAGPRPKIAAAPPSLQQKKTSGVPAPGKVRQQMPASRPAGDLSSQGPISRDELLKIIKPAVRDRFTSVALAGLTPQGVQTLLSNALTGQDMRAQMDLFGTMEDTWPMLAKCVQELKRSLQAAEWRVEPFAERGQEPSQEAQRRADLVSHMLGAWKPQAAVLDESGWNGFVYDLADAWTRGVSVQELMWQNVEDAGGLGAAMLPRAACWVLPGYYAMRDDPENGSVLRLFDTQSRAGAGYDFPPDKFVIARHRARTGFTTQTAMLRPLAALWINASFSHDWILNLGQLFGIPFRWVTYDESAPPTQRDSILAMLQTMGSAGYAAFPEGTTLQLAEMNKEARETPQSWIIEFADTACQLLLLGQTLTTDVGQSGSRALGDVHKTVRGDVMNALARWASGELNAQLVPSLMRLNFGDEQMMPRLIADVEEEEDAKANAERDKILVGDMGLPVGRKWLYERHNIPQPKDGEDLFLGRPPAQPQLQPGVTPKGEVRKDAPGTDPNADAPGAPKEPNDMSTPEESANDEVKKAKAMEDAATERVVDSVMENLTVVEARWLGGVKPFFAQLVRAAKDDKLSDADFVHVLQRATAHMPELFAHLRTHELETALFNAMSASLANGVTLAWIEREKKRRGHA